MHDLKRSKKKMYKKQMPAMINSYNEESTVEIEDLERGCKNKTNINNSNNACNCAGNQSTNQNNNNNQNNNQQPVNPQGGGNVAKFCPNCGTPNNAGSNFCPNCGTKLVL